jgi:hypothetical protein
MDLLRLHPSFWTREKGFATWQLLRRTAYYREWSREFQWQDTAKLFDDSGIARYFKNYPTLQPDENYARWGHRVRREAPGDLKALEKCGRGLQLLSGFLPQPPKQSRIPADWFPIPSEITFPHPNVLDKLTPSTLGVAVIVIPRNHKKKEPFKGLSPLTIGGKHFGVDLDHSDDDIYKVILGFEFPGVSSKAAQTKLIANVRDQLKELRKVSVRDRSTKDGLSMIAAALTAWDLYPIKKLIAYAQNIEKGQSKPDFSELEGDAISMIAEELWPTEYPAKRKVLRERVRNYLKYAQKEIGALIP